MSEVYALSVLIVKIVEFAIHAENSSKNEYSMPDGSLML